MRYALAITAVAVAGTLALAQPPTSVRQTVMLDLPGVNVREVVASPNRNTLYYVTDDALMSYDRARKRTTQLLARVVRSLTVSTRGDLLAFADRDEDQKLHIAVLPLDPTTGLAAGLVRRVSIEIGDTPAISPDGKWIAFAGHGVPDMGKQRVAVIPIAGGPERVVTQTDGYIEPVGWTPDGKWIHFHLDGGSGKAGKYRVSAAGGTPTSVREGIDGWAGASPDARLLVVTDNKSERFVYDSAGRKLGAIPKLCCYSWSGPMSILGVIDAERIVLRTLSLTTGAIGQFPTPSGLISAVAWSRDGKRIAVARQVRGATEVLIMGADGSNQRTYAIKSVAPQLLWSPDGQWVAYRGFDRAPIPRTGVEVAAIEVATGRSIPVARGEGNSGFGIGPFSWTRDSKRLVVPIVADSSDDPDGRYLWRVHEVSLSGGDRVVAEARSEAHLTPLTPDSLFLFSRTRSGESVIRGADGKSRTVLLPAGSSLAVPTLSADGKWMAVNSGQGTGGLRSPAIFNRIDVMRTDGSERTTIALPFTIGPGQFTTLFLPNNRELIVQSMVGAADSVRRFYRVNIATKSTTEIAAAAPIWLSHVAGFAVSPDGSRLMFTARIPPHSTIVEFDVSLFVKPSPK